MAVFLNDARVVFVCIAVLQFLSLLQILLFIALSCKRGWYKDCVKGLHSGARDLARFLDFTKGDAEAQLVDSKLQEGRCKLMLQLAKIMCVPLLLRMVLVQIYLADGEEAHPFAPTLDESNMIAYALMLTLAMFPKLLSPVTLDVWYIMFQALCSVPMLFESDENLIQSSLTSLFFRLLLAVCARRTWLAMGANMLYWLAVVQHSNFSPSSKIFQRQTLEIVLLFVTVAVVRFQQFAHTRLVLDLNSAKVDLDASSALLRALCDSVVEVDAELKIVGKSKQTCSLPSVPTCCGLDKGLNLLSFFSQEDRSHIANTLQQSAGIRQALALNARMLDGFGYPCDVELLHVPFVNTAGKDCRLVGIRDFRATEQTEVPTETTATAAEMLQDIVAQDMSVLFDATTFELLSASEDFCDFLARGGRPDVKVQNLTLTDLFTDTRPSSLCGRIQDAVNSAANGHVEDFCCYDVELGDDRVHVMVSLEHDAVLDQLVGTLCIAATSSNSPLTERNVACLPTSERLLENIHI